MGDNKNQGSVCPLCGMDTKAITVDAISANVADRFWIKLEENVRGLIAVELQAVDVLIEKASMGDDLFLQARLMSAKAEMVATAAAKFKPSRSRRPLKAGE